MTLHSRTQALLDLVEDDRRVRCDAIADEAHERAQALLGQACAEARARVREAFAEERKRAHERIAAATAMLATRRRQAEQRRAAALLALGLARLPEALAHLWRDAPTRAAWVDAVLASALGVLPHTPWRIAHPDDWPAGERQAALARVTAGHHAELEFVADPRIAAGLRISANGIVVDGTLAGVVADRRAIGARLLGLLAEEA